jgi:hypothetical protein
MYEEHFAKQIGTIAGNEVGLPSRDKLFHRRRSLTVQTPMPKLGPSAARGATA